MIAKSIMNVYLCRFKLYFEPKNDRKTFVKVMQNETEDMRIHNKDEYDVAVKGS